MDDKKIYHVCQQIIDKFSPEKIILFSCKHSPSGRLSSFKLCIIVDGGDADMIEHDIYMGIDCDIPFDALVYDKSDFDKISLRSGSFAQRIVSEGSVLYEKQK